MEVDLNKLINYLLLVSLLKPQAGGDEFFIVKVFFVLNFHFYFKFDQKD